MKSSRNIKTKSKIYFDNYADFILEFYFENEKHQLEFESNFKILLTRN